MHFFSLCCKWFTRIFTDVLLFRNKSSKLLKDWKTKIEIKVESWSFNKTKTTNKKVTNNITSTNKKKQTKSNRRNPHKTKKLSGWNFWQHKFYEIDATFTVFFGRKMLATPAWKLSGWLLPLFSEISHTPEISSTWSCQKLA